MKVFNGLLILILFTSCVNDEPILSSVETMVVTNLDASAISLPGKPQSGNFVKFSFKKHSVVSGDDWDIAFRSTTILVNGGFSGGSDEPERSGIGAGYVSDIEYGNVKNVNENLFKQDSETSKAILDESGKGWYNEDGFLIIPITGRTLIFKTHNGRYAKMKIQSFYKNSPQILNVISSIPEYYTFNYTYQPNKGLNSFD